MLMAVRGFHVMRASCCVVYICLWPPDNCFTDAAEKRISVACISANVNAKLFYADDKKHLPGTYARNDTLIATDNKGEAAAMSSSFLLSSICRHGI